MLLSDVENNPFAVCMVLQGSDLTLLALLCMFTLYMYSEWYLYRSGSTMCPKVSITSWIQIMNILGLVAGPLKMVCLRGTSLRIQCSTDSINAHSHNISFCYSM